MWTRPDLSAKRPSGRSFDAGTATHQEVVTQRRGCQPDPERLAIAGLVQRAAGRDPPRPRVDGKGGFAESGDGRRMERRGGGRWPCAPEICAGAVTISVVAVAAAAAAVRAVPPLEGIARPARRRAAPGGRRPGCPQARKFPIRRSSRSELPDLVPGQCAASPSARAPGRPGVRGAGFPIWRQSAGAGRRFWVAAHPPPLKTDQSRARRTAPRRLWGLTGPYELRSRPALLVTLIIDINI